MSKFFRRSAEFTEIPQSEVDADMEALIRKEQPMQRAHRSWMSRLCSPLCLLTGLIVGAYAGSCYVERMANLDNRCIKHIAEPSPVIEEVNIEFEPINFNGSLFKKTVYRQDAGPAVDAAWQALGVDYRAAVIPTEVAVHSDLTPAHVQVSPKYGGGYLANVEGLHHLHCLNLLRQSLFYNFDYYHKEGKGAFKNSDAVLKAHVTHCLDTLRQQLMCTVDVGMLGQVWWNKESPQAYPDFDTRHMCRNFEAVRHWAEIHQAPEETPDDFLMAPISDEAVLPEIP